MAVTSRQAAPAWRLLREGFVPQSRAREAESALRDGAPAAGANVTDNEGNSRYTQCGLQLGTQPARSSHAAE